MPRTVPSHSCGGLAGPSAAPLLPPASASASQHAAGWGRHAEHAPKLWGYLNELKPYLWPEGETYPKDENEPHGLFANGEDVQWAWARRCR